VNAAICRLLRGLTAEVAENTGKGIKNKNSAGSANSAVKAVIKPPYP